MKIKKYLMIMLAAVSFAACSSSDDDTTPSVDPVDAVAEVNYVKFLDADVKTVSATFTNPIIDAPTIKGYENPNSKVSSLSFAFNVSTNSVYMVTETVNQSAFSFTNILAYFAKNYTFIGSEDGVSMYTNNSDLEKATVVISTYKNEDGDTFIMYVDPTNAPAEEEGEGVELSSDNLAGFIGQSWADVSEDYADYIENYGESIYGMTISDNLVSAAFFSVDNGTVKSVILLYEADEADDAAVISYYKGLGYTVTSNGKDEDGQDQYTFENDTYSIAYAGQRGVITKK